MRRVAVAMAVALLTAAVALAQGVPFPDVPVGHWAAQAVQEMKDLGVVTGFPDGEFKGDRTTTRYELAAMLSRFRAKIPAPGPGAVGSVTGLVLGLPNVVVQRWAGSSAYSVPITWGTCTGYYACRAPFRMFTNGAAGDEMRVGLFAPFRALHLRLFAPGAGGTAAWEYWTGSVWSPLLGVQDGTAGLTADGLVRWTVPPDWPKASLDSSEPLHWIRFRAVTAWSSPPIASEVGVPAPGAALAFRGPALWQGSTDPDGVYATPEIPVGAYVVHLNAPGWVPFVYLVPVSPGFSAMRHIGPIGP